MYRRKIEQDFRCPLEYAMEIMSGKWTIRVMCLLDNERSLRYGEIRSYLGDVTDAALTAALSRVVNNGLVERIDYHEMPPHVEYRMTDKAKEIAHLFRAMCRWASEQHEIENPLSFCRECENNLNK